MRRSFWAGVLGTCVAACAAGCGGGGSGPTPPPNPLYVSTCRGSDGNSGDQGHPLRTISRAAQIALDAYKIYVGSGTYDEGVTTTTQGAAPRGLQFIADVTGTYTGDQPGPVIVAGFDLPNSGCVGAPPVCGLIDGFEVTGGAAGGIVLKSHSDAFTVQNCIVHDNRGPGIHVQDSSAVLIFNNLVYNNNGEGVGLVGPTAGSPNARVYNNTIVDNTSHGLTVGTTQAASPKATVQNNIIESNDTSSPSENIKVITTPHDSETGYQGDFNLVSPKSYSPAGIKGPDDINVDAQFKDISRGDFHLQAASPAIDAGTALDLPDPQLTAFRARTTTGTSADTGVLDLGFHYPTSSLQLTPRPCPQTPHPTPSPTPTVVP